MKKIFLLLILVAALVTGAQGAFAQSGHMKLLAVSETAQGYVGGTADLYLEIKPGSGRIFLETFPFTKVDTQMSTRFANEIACDYIDADCSHYDFFYTLTANSAIIGGPSAGAAIAVLTIAMLEGTSTNEDVAVTGTINAGGLIGPVGGLKEKVKAGGQIGLKTILIPKGESLSANETERQQLEEMRSKGVEVVEVYTLNEAVYYFTGKHVKQQRALDISSQYSDTMRSLAEQLCERTEKLRRESEQHSLPLTNRTQQSMKFALNLSQKGVAAFEDQTYYAAASYCFGANVEYAKLGILGKNMSALDKENSLENLFDQISALEEDVESAPIRTITDLESYMVAKERLLESKDLAMQAQNASSAEEYAAALAWAQERLHSAQSWFEFSGTPGKQYSIDEDSLATSCALKLAEAEERIQYLELFLPVALSTARGELQDAEHEAALGNYELCLFKASKAKANVGVVLGIFGVKEELYKEVLLVKLDIVKQMIAEQSEKGAFPILGYSYYEYADSLKESDLISALLYAEYALELGNLDMYFSQSAMPHKQSSVQIDSKLLGMFVAGVLVGAVSVLTIRKQLSGAQNFSRKIR